MTRRTSAALVAVALALVACGGGEAAGNGSPAPTATATGVELVVIPQASYDLAAGTDQRLIFGASLADRTLIGGGSLQASVISLPSPDATSGTLISQGPASFLVVPGMQAPEGDLPAPIDGVATSGVYQLRTDLPNAGFYGLAVTGELADGRAVAGTAVFAVAEDHLVVAAGDQAPRTDNPTVDDDVALVTLDSCAMQGNPCDPGNPDAPPALPDPHLHETSIADSIAAGRPVVVLVATPVFCVSRFCGPITNAIADVALEYQDRVDFVHLEVWEDFQDQAMNEAAAEWIRHPDGSATEPWVFLVGPDGRITARWGNVLDIEELTGLLDELPPFGG